MEVVNVVALLGAKSIQVPIRQDIYEGLEDERITLLEFEPIRKSKKIEKPLIKVKYQGKTYTLKVVVEKLKTGYISYYILD